MMGGMPYGSCLTIEQRLARVEQAMLRSAYLADATVTADPGAAADQDIASVTFTADGITPVIVEFGLGLGITSGVAAQIIGQIRTAASGGGTRIWDQRTQVDAAEVTGLVGATHRFVPTAATHTYYFRLFVNAGTIDPDIAATAPAYLRVRRAV